MAFNVNPPNFRTLRGLAEHTLCNGSTFTKIFDVPVKLPEKTLVWINASVASNNTAVSAELSFILIHNDNL